MVRRTYAVLLTVLTAALICCLAALAAQGSEISALRSSITPYEYRGEVSHMFVADAAYLQRLIKRQNQPGRTINALVTVTAYNAVAAQTDDDPNIAASMRHVRPGTIAVSRDLFNHGWVFGRKVRLEGLGIYVINDLMAARHGHAVDIYLGSSAKAQAFGRRHLRAALLNI